MHSDAKNLLKELKSGLAALYGDRLYGVYLYGSYARGDYDAESHIELFVLDDFESYGAEVDRIAELPADLSLEQGVSISQVFFRAHDWTRGDTPFLRSVREEAIAA